MDSIIFTNKAQCQDCNRCVRKCPVKAIKVENAQASVDANKCIHCGTCIRECPQQAKHYRRDVYKAKELLTGGSKVAVSLAPSFAGIYDKWQWHRLPSALRKLGFDYIAETSTGAFFSAKATKEEYVNSKSSQIATACPAIVSYIEKYKPEKVSNLVKIVSPMIAHAKYLKELFANKGEDIKIVFIGPCTAKKAEAEREEFAGLVDVALTFQELDEWLIDEGIKYEELEESNFDEKAPDIAKLFPLMGGLIKTAEMDADIHSYNIINVSGINEITEAFDLIDSTPDTDFLIDPLFCSQGCLNGPGIDTKYNIFERRRHLLQYKDAAESIDCPTSGYDIDYHTEFDTTIGINTNKFTEAEIAQVLAKTGEADHTKRLNCGACGYDSCREKAIAVLEGMAETEMCLPYVRRIAESRKNKLFETTPNGVVILDYRYNIINMNPAFRKFFICSQSIVGKPISYLMDPEPFVKLVADETDQVMELTVKHDNYNVVCHQILYKLPEESLIVGIFVNITKNVADNTQLAELREKTISQAQELLNHQIDMAQNFAKLLGETAARGEALVDNLMKMSQDQNSNDNNSNKKNGNWLWDIYTTK